MRLPENLTHYFMKPKEFSIPSDTILPKRSIKISLTRKNNNKIQRIKIPQFKETNQMIKTYFNKIRTFCDLKS